MSLTVALSGNRVSHFHGSHTIIHRITLLYHGIARFSDTSMRPLRITTFLQCSLPFHRDRDGPRRTETPNRRTYLAHHQQGPIGRYRDEGQGQEESNRLVHEPHKGHGCCRQSLATNMQQKWVAAVFSPEMSQLLWLMSGNPGRRAQSPKP